MAKSSIDISILGDKKLKKKMLKLDPKLQKKVWRPATREALKKTVLPTAKSNVPIREGDLQNSGKVRAASKKRTGRRGEVGAVVVFGEGLEDGRATFQEFGTDHHDANPYLRPAKESEQKNAIRLVEDELKRQLPKVVKGA